MTNAIFRMHVREQNKFNGGATESFLKMQKRIDRTAVSLAANSLAMSSTSCRTVLSSEFIERNKVVHIKLKVLSYFGVSHVALLS